MSDIRHLTLAALSFTLLFGTCYSVLYTTYLDTSNPLSIHTPHPLSGTHYFASKSNFLNVWFIKKAWGWTSAVFLFTLLTSPRPSSRTGEKEQEVEFKKKESVRRFGKWLILTAVWLIFTSWFFGAPILDRVVVYSGGECIASFPTGDHISVPHELCYNRAKLSPQSHPDLFTGFSSAFTSHTPDMLESLRITPRLRKGHDISGHVFLVTMSVLFLVDQLRPSFSRTSGVWSTLHSWAIAAQLSLIAVWFAALYTTAVYFHSPFEKFTGYLLGVASFGLSQLI